MVYFEETVCYAVQRVISLVQGFQLSTQFSINYLRDSVGGFTCTLWVSTFPCHNTAKNFVDLISLGNLPSRRKIKLKFGFVSCFAGNWSKIARAVGNRTDNQCWRRWIVLCKDDVSFMLLLYITEIRRRNTRTMTSCITLQAIVNEGMRSHLMAYRMKVIPHAVMRRPCEQIQFAGITSDLFCQCNFVLLAILIDYRQFKI